MTPVIFMHIPKCAGSSFNATLKQVYGDRFMQLTPHDGKYPAEYGQAEAFSGHIMMDHEVYGKLKNFVHLTILREPVERVIDAYHYLLESVIHPYHEMALETNLRDAVLTKDSTWGLQNLMTWHLSGLSDRQENGWIRLEVAKENLEKFHLFGFVDHYSEFIAECNGLLGWDAKEEKVNMTKMDPVYDDKIKELIACMNYLDMELYEFAKRLKYGSS